VQLPAGTVLDGEAVVWSGERLDFTQLQRRVIAQTRAAHLARVLPASFVAFDLLAWDGEVWTDRPLRERRRQLKASLSTLSPPIQLSPGDTRPGRRC
jgi:ATP-dependent DNA ligase